MDIQEVEKNIFLFRLSGDEHRLVTECAPEAVKVATAIGRAGVKKYVKVLAQFKNCADHPPHDHRFTFNEASEFRVVMATVKINSKNARLVTGAEKLQDEISAATI